MGSWVHTQVHSWLTVENLSFVRSLERKKKRKRYLFRNFENNTQGTRE